MNSPCRVAREGDARTPRYAYAYACTASSRRVRTSHRGKLPRSDSIRGGSGCCSKSGIVAGDTRGAGECWASLHPHSSTRWACVRSCEVSAAPRVSAWCAASLRLLHTRPGESAEACWCAALCACSGDARARARRYCDGELGLHVPAVACGNAPSTHPCSRAGGVPQRMAARGVDDWLSKCRQRK